MGRATKWLKGMFWIKKDKEGSNSRDWKDEKLRTFGNSARDSRNHNFHNPDQTIPPNISAAEAAWPKSYYTELESEQNQHAIAVAVATAAAADAAIAAAQAAVAVVRLTSQGRGSMNMFGGESERWASVKIQTIFRGFLARKALRALKGLVKLQALVRGYLVRKQATATLRGMQALIRAQATVRSQKARVLVINNETDRSVVRARKSMQERFDDSTVSERMAPIHSRKLSASLMDTIINSIDGSPKIVEIDTGRHKSRSCRTHTTSVSDFGDDPPYQTPFSPILTSRRISILECLNFHDQDYWDFTADECRFSSTAQSTPRLVNSSNTAPATPAKSVCADNFFPGYGNDFPNYMANTQSFKAKLRSDSVPKQRPGPGPNKRHSLNEIMLESRSSLSGLRMRRSCSQLQVHEAVSFKNAVMGKLERSSEYGKKPADHERIFLQRRW